MPAVSPWVELIADELRARGGVKESPCDVMKLSSALGYRVERVKTLGGPVGLLVGKTIAVLENIPPPAAQITVGHELAHTINDEWRVIPERPDWLHEYQMDAVALALVMPRSAVTSAYLRGAEPAEIARGCGSPVDASAIRAMAIYLWSIGRW